MMSAKCCPKSNFDLIESIKPANRCCYFQHNNSDIRKSIILREKSINPFFIKHFFIAIEKFTTLIVYAIRRWRQ